jgi:dTDP-4-dehydrorhamnose reductase
VRILVTGASGFLGAYVVDALVASGHDVLAWSGRDPGGRSGVPFRPIDLTATERLPSLLDSADPDAIVHLAAISAASEVLKDRARAFAVNVASTSALADWCAFRARRLIFTSTDLVFDGSRPWNREHDPAEPVLSYGQTKRSAELAVLSCPLGLVARLPLMFGPSLCGKPGFFDSAISDLCRGNPRTFFADEYRTPLDYGTAAMILTRLIPLEATGTLHVAGAERVSRFDLMRRLASAMRLDAALVLPGLRADVPGPEPRPGDVSLDTTRLAEILPAAPRPTIEEAASGWS